MIKFSIVCQLELARKCVICISKFFARFKGLAKILIILFEDFQWARRVLTGAIAGENERTMETAGKGVLGVSLLLFDFACSILDKVTWLI